MSPLGRAVAIISSAFFPGEDGEDARVLIHYEYLSGALYVLDYFLSRNETVSAQRCIAIITHIICDMVQYEAGENQDMWRSGFMSSYINYVLNIIFLGRPDDSDVLPLDHPVPVDNATSMKIQFTQLFGIPNVQLWNALVPEAERYVVTNQPGEQSWRHFRALYSIGSIMERISNEHRCASMEDALVKVYDYFGYI